MPEKMFCLLEIQGALQVKGEKRPTPLSSVIHPHRRPPRSWNDASGDAERKQKKSSKAEWSVQEEHRAWTSTIMS